MYVCFLRPLVLRCSLTAAAGHRASQDGLHISGRERWICSHAQRAPAAAYAGQERAWRHGLHGGAAGGHLCGVKRQSGHLDDVWGWHLPRRCDCGRTTVHLKCLLSKVLSLPLGLRLTNCHHTMLQTFSTCCSTRNPDAPKLSQCIPYAGEAPLAAQPATPSTCAADCPVTLGTCPSPGSAEVGDPARPCGGNGWCQLATLACACATGYAGDGCEYCAERYVAMPAAPSDAQDSGGEGSGVQRRCEPYLNIWAEVDNGEALPEARPVEQVRPQLRRSCKSWRHGDRKGVACHNVCCSALCGGTCWRWSATSA